MRNNIFSTRHVKGMRSRNTKLPPTAGRILKSVPVDRLDLDRDFRLTGNCRKRKIFSNLRQRIRPLKISADLKSNLSNSSWKWKESRARNMKFINQTIDKIKMDHWKNQLTDVKLKHIDTFSRKMANPVSNLAFKVNERISETAMKRDSSSNSSYDPIAAKKRAQVSVIQKGLKKQGNKILTEAPSVFTNMDASTNVHTFDNKTNATMKKETFDRALNLVKRRCRYRNKKTKVKSINHFSPSSKNSINYILQDALIKAQIPIQAKNEPRKIEAYEKVGLRKDRKDWSSYNRTKNRTTYSVKESHIPYEILFNPDIDEVRDEEMILNQKVKPITFQIEETGGGKNIKYEIEGGGKMFETMVVRQNEEVFFSFLNDFSTNKTQLKKMKTRIEQLQRANTRKTKATVKSISPMKMLQNPLKSSVTHISPLNVNSPQIQSCTSKAKHLPRGGSFLSAVSMNSDDSEDFVFSPIKVTAPEASKGQEGFERAASCTGQMGPYKFKTPRKFEESTISSQSPSRRSSILSLNLAGPLIKERPGMSFRKSKDLEIVDESDSGSDSSDIKVDVMGKDHKLTVKPQKIARKSQSKVVIFSPAFSKGGDNSDTFSHDVKTPTEVPQKPTLARKISKKMTIQKKRGFYSNLNKNKSVGISKIQEEVKLERNQSEIKIRKGVNNKFRVQIPQNKMFKKYQTIIKEIGQGRQSKMTTIRDQSVYSGEEDDMISAISPTMEEKNGMFFFDIENPNKIIQRVLQSKKDKKVEVKKNIIDNTLKPKYGAKWYIQPKDWLKIYQDELKQINHEDEKSHHTILKTNSTLQKLIEKHNLSKNKKALIKRQSKASFSSSSDFESNSKDSIENFEDQMMKVIDKDKKS
ncbi:unnamed protein product [Moneuplotes crassus]|uniref:Uncharacterized protein n=1 Tax=Euplotes crassus TaxID=5936 RepID=A0AAD1UGL3_EUPCR|nr:unnamed protein product [Moneuplotes crassus]